MKGLDRYLTTEPQDDFTPFCENTFEKLSDETYRQMEESKFTGSEVESAFLAYLFDNLPDDSFHPYFQKSANSMTSFFKHWYYFTNPKGYYDSKISQLK